MPHTGSAAEKFVYNVCKKSFLSLWSYANPQGKNGKELCDILIVCGNDVIIFSVKNIQYIEKDNFTLDQKRWQKRAIESSCNQLYGAERWIISAKNVIKSDGSKGVEFPHTSSPNIHRVAVALGGDNKVFIKYGDFGKGLVHVFDEISFNIVLAELDTISDFTKYLSDKEKFYHSNKQIMHSGEEDLLAIYLHNGRLFPNGGSLIIVDDNLWQKFIKKPEYLNKKSSDKDSYAWDRLIELICHDSLHDNLEFGPSMNEIELALRTMALEDRFSRRILSKSFSEFMELATQKKVRSRMLQSYSNVVYVFLALPKEEDRKFRVAELGNRCFIARGTNRNCTTVIGLATERYDGRPGFSFDLLYLCKEIWTEKDQNHMEQIKKELELFASPLLTPFREDEYPIN